MRFWFDTEFYENGKTIELISISVIAEDGREYYAETMDADTLADSTDWLRANVRPHLRGIRKERERIAMELIAFMGVEPEIWAYYGAYDWVVLCQLFGTMLDLPKGWPKWCADVKQLAYFMGDPALPAQEKDEHYALADARWTREAWSFLWNMTQ